MASRERMPAEQRRAQLLEVARDCFTTDGYRVTTADVAERAGVSQALVIKYFRTKEELYRSAVVEPLFALLEQAVTTEAAVDVDDFGGPADHLERLVAIGTVWVYLVRDQAPSMLSLLRESTEFTDLQDRTLELWRNLAHRVSEELRRHAESGHYRDFDIQALTEAGLGALTLGGMVSDNPEKVVRQYFEAVLRGVLTDEGRAELDAGAR